MEIVILAEPADVARAAAAQVLDLVRSHPTAVLGLATGSSPLGVYEQLALQVGSGTLDLSATRAFALDEYVGIPASRVESYAHVIRADVVEPLNMNPDLVRVPDGRADDLELACRHFEADIAEAGGIDLQILGIGANGHIGFNEPTSSFSSRTRVKTLAPRTRADNARFFSSPDEVPTHCITQGLGTIMQARQVVLVAQGVTKAAAVAAAIEGPVSSMCPASILQHHPKVTFIVDRAAASELTLTDYYQYVYDNKPEWQVIRLPD